MKNTILKYLIITLLSISILHAETKTIDEDAPFDHNLSAPLTSAEISSLPSWLTYTQTPLVSKVHATGFFDTVKQMVVDSDGNLFIADYGKNKIYKLTPEGVLSTYAGNGLNDDPESNLQLNKPAGLLIDANDNLYVGCQTILKKVTPNSPTEKGTISTISGTATAGYTDGGFDISSHYNIFSLTFDSTGRIIMADNGKIRRVDLTDNTVTTIASPGGYNSATVDTNDNIFVSNLTQHKIYKISAGTSDLILFAGNGESGFVDATGTAARFKYPDGITIDNENNLYVVDRTNYRIRKITPAGVVTTIAGSGINENNWLDGPVDAATSSIALMNIGIFIDENTNIMYIGARTKIAKYYIERKLSGTPTNDDVGSHTIGDLEITVTNINDAPTSISKAVTINEEEEYHFTGNEFSFLDVDTGDTLVAVKITRLPSKGTLTFDGNATSVNDMVPVADIDKLIYTPEVGGYGLNYTNFGYKVNDGEADATISSSLTINILHTAAHEDELYSRDLSIILNSTEINSLPSWLTYSTGSMVSPVYVGSLLNSAKQMVVDSYGNLFIADAGINRIFKLTPDGAMTYYAGNSHMDDPESNLQLKMPTGLLIDANDNLYVGCQTILKKVTPDSPNSARGTISTISGTATAGYTDGDFNSSSHYNIYSLTFDSTGDIIMGDSGKIRRVDLTDNTVTTIASPGGYNSATVDTNDNIFVTNLTQHKIYKISAGTSDLILFAGNGESGFVDATGTAARFKNPDGITIDSDNNLYVVDRSNLKIRKITPTGVVTTIVGNGISTEPNWENGTIDADASNIERITIGIFMDKNTDTLYFARTTIGKYHHKSNLLGTPTNDDVGTYNIGDIYINAINVNDVPTASNSIVTTDEDINKVFTSSMFNYEDIDIKHGDMLESVKITQLPPHGTLQFNDINVTLNQEINTTDITSGKFKFVPTPQENGTPYTSFKFKVNDGEALSALAYTMTINVTSVEDVPVVTNKSMTMDEDSATQSVNLKDGMYDYDNNINHSSLHMLTQPSGGTVTFDTDGIVTYTPDLNWNGTTFFTYSVSDTTSLTSDIKTVSINVDAVNDAPVALTATFSTPEDTTLSDVRIFDYATDVDSVLNRGSFSRVSDPTGGILTTDATGLSTYVPTANWNGTDSFEFMVTDDHNVSSTAMIYINVTSDNDIPVAVPDNATTPEDIAIDIDIAGNDTDEDGYADLNISSISIETPPANGTVVKKTDGTYTYTPNANWNGTDTFIYTIKDMDSFISNTAVVTIVVTNVDDKPVSVDDIYTTNEDVVKVLAVLANDTDEDTPILSDLHIITQPTNGTLVVSHTTGQVTYTPNLNWFGDDSFEYRAYDGINDSENIATVTIHVVSVNDAPTITSTAVTTATESSYYSYNVLTDDIENDVLNFNSSTIPDWLSIGNDGVLSGTPEVPGTYNIDIVVSDGTLTSNETFTITVANVNDTPVVAEHTFALSEHDPLGINIGAIVATDEDTDDNSFVYTIVSGNETNRFTINSATGMLKLVDVLDGYVTPRYYLKITAQDTTGAVSAEGTATITVVNEADAPIVTDKNITIDEDGSTTIALLDGATDADDNINIGSVVVTVQPQNGTVVVDGSGNATYTPDANWHGTEIFKFKVSDTTPLDSNEATVTITVTSVNDAPVAQNGTINIDEDTSLLDGNLATYSSDVDEDILTYVTSSPTDGNLSIEFGKTLYTPRLNFYGVDSFTYTVSDGTLTDTATIYINVAPINDIPVSKNDVGSGQEDYNITIDILANDTDDMDLDVSTVVIEVQPTNGTVTVDNTDGSVVYTPNANWFGSDTFKYSVKDDGLASVELPITGVLISNVSTVTITVASVNDRPVAVNDSFILEEDSLLLLNLHANDTDADGPLSGTNINMTQPSHGTTELTADGFVRYIPTANYAGTDSFQYSISDGEASSAIATVSLTITAVNDTPRFLTTSNHTTIENTTDDIVTFTAEDVESNPTFTYTIVAGKDGALFILTGTNLDTLKFIDAPDYEDSHGSLYSIDINVTDNGGASDIKTFEITVLDQPISITSDATQSIVENLKIISTIVSTREGHEEFTIDGDDSDDFEISSDGNITLINNADFETKSIYHIIINILNDNSIVASQDMTINVLNENDAPTIEEIFSYAGDGTLRKPENEHLTYTIHTNDEDGDTLNFDSSVLPSWLSMDNATNLLSGTPYISGVYPVKIIVSDGLLTNSIDFNVSVSNVNDTPIIEQQTFAVSEDANNSDVVGIVLVDDEDVADVNFTFAITDGNIDDTFSIDENNGTIKLEKPLNATLISSYSLTVGATDSSGATGSNTIMITINDEAYPPVVFDDNNTTAEDTNATINVLVNDTDKDDNINPQTVTIVTQPTNGSVVVDASGNIIYTPNENYNGTDWLLYKVFDNVGLESNEANLSITITPVNDAPIAINQTFNMREDENISDINLTIMGSDVDGDILAFLKLDVNNIHGTIVKDETTGLVTYTPDGNYYGFVTCTFTVTDGDGEYDTGSIQINIAPVNDIPIANDENITTNEDNAININILANDTDVDTDSGVNGGIDPATVVIEANAINGTVDVEDNGTVTYTPNDNWYGVDTFTYTVKDTGLNENNVTDGVLISNTALVTVTVTSVNDEPVAVADAFGLDEDTTLLMNLHINDTDVDNVLSGTNITLSSTITTTNGTLILTPEGFVSYTPNQNWNGTDTFEYMISDGETNSSSATVTLTVNIVNDLPSFITLDDNITILENNISTIVTFTGEDLESLTSVTFSLDTTTKDGALFTVTTDGKLSFTAEADFENPLDENMDNVYKVDMIITDADDGNTTKTFSITVTNEPIVITSSASMGVAENQLDIATVATSSEDNAQTFAITGGTDSASFTIANDGLLSFRANPSFETKSTYTVEVTVTDSAGLSSDTQTITVTVLDRNEAPIIGAGVTTTATEDLGYSYTITTTDEDTDTSWNTLHFSNSTLPNWLSIDNSTKVLSGTPTIPGTYNVNLVVTDGELSDTQNFDIVVANVNDIPVVAIQAFAISESEAIGSVVGTVLATDSDIADTTFTFVLIGDTNNTFSMDSATGTITLAKELDGYITPSYALTVTATDTSNATSAAAAITITIRNEADAPVAKNDSATTNEDEPITINNLTNNDSDADKDMDSTSVRVTVEPQNGTVVINASGYATYTPNENWNGTDTFKYKVFDAIPLASNEATVTVTVRPVNDRPVATTKIMDTDEDTLLLRVTSEGLASDVDGDQLTFTINTNPTNGTIVGSSLDTRTYLPNLDFYGFDSFTYDVTDGHLTDTGTININIAPINDIPVAKPDVNTTNEDTAITIHILDNDTDDSALDVSKVVIEAQPTNGTVTVNTDGTVLYTPTAYWNGTDTFTYTVKDDGLASVDLPITGVLISNVTTVTIHVTGVNNAPVAVDDSFTLNEDDKKFLNLHANDTDADGYLNGDIIEIVTLPTNGTVVLQGYGVVAYTPNADYNGTDSFTYRISDGTLWSETNATVSLTIANVNDAPKITTRRNKSIVENSTASIMTITAVDTDGDTAFTYDVVNTLDGQYFTVATNGDVSFKSGADFENPLNINGDNIYNVEISANDGKNKGIGTRVFNITVTNAPVIITSSATQSAEENQQVVSTIDSTIEGGETFEIIGVDANSFIVSDVGVLRFVGNPDFETKSTYSITIQILDYLGSLVAEQDMTITVTDANDAPEIITTPIANIAENDTYSYTIDTSDVDVGSTVNFNSSTLPEWLSLVDNNATSKTLTGVSDVPGTFNVQIVVSDGTLTDTQNFTISVSNVNDAPQLVDTGFAISENSDAGVIGQLRVNDEDVDDTNFEYRLVSENNNTNGITFSVNTYTGELYLSENLNAYLVSTYELKVEVTDDENASSIGTVTVTITNENDSPIAVADSGNTNEDTNITINLLANDTDEDYNINAGSIVISQNPSNGSVDINSSGFATYTPDENWNGTDTFNYTVTDMTNLTSNEVTVTIVVAPVNDAPIAINQTFNMNEDERIVDINLNIMGSDVDGDILTFLKEDNANFSGTIKRTGDLVTYTPVANFYGFVNCTFTVTDPGALQSRGTVNINIAPVNDVPVAGNDNISTNEDNAININILANDTDVDTDLGTNGGINPATVVIEANATNGTVVVETNGTVTYTPNDNWYGIDTFTYTVKDTGLDVNGTIDGVLISNTATVTVNVTSVNDAPIATDDSFTLGEDTILSVNLHINDTDIDDDLSGSNIVFVTQPGHGAIELKSDGLVTYIPTKNYDGADSFLYKINDGTVDSNEANVSFTIVRKNEAPSFISVKDVYITEDNTSTILRLEARDSDSDESLLTYEKLDGKDSAFFTVTADGNLSFIVGADYENPQDVNKDNVYNVDAQVSDAEGATNLRTFNITVTNIYEADVDDTDGDGIVDNLDDDIDGNGVSNVEDGKDVNATTGRDTDGDGIPDYRDFDSDGDGVSDIDEGIEDTDGDGVRDYIDTDTDGDGLSDELELSIVGNDRTVDTDGDGIPNFRDTDTDGDGILDEDEDNMLTDTDGDGVIDYFDDLDNRLGFLVRTANELSIDLVDNKSLHAVTSDVILPTYLNGCDIVWTSSSNLIDIAGNIGDRTTITNGATKEILTAKISKGDKTYNKIFTLRVLKDYGDTNNSVDVNATIDMLNMQDILGENIHSLNIKYDMNLYNDGVDGTYIVWSSSDTSIIDTDGVFGYRPNQDTMITLIATASKGDAIPQTKKFQVRVTKAMTSSQKLLDVSKQITTETILGSNRNMNLIRYDIDLTLDKYDLEDGITLEFKTSNTNAIDNAGAVRQTKEKQIVTVRAIITDTTTNNISIKEIGLIVAGTHENIRILTLSDTNVERQVNGNGKLVTYFVVKNQEIVNDIVESESTIGFQAENDHVEVNTDKYGNQITVMDKLDENTIVKTVTSMLSNNGVVETKIQLRKTPDANEVDVVENTIRSELTSGTLMRFENGEVRMEIFLDNNNESEVVSSPDGTLTQIIKRQNENDNIATRLISSVRGSSATITEAGTVEMISPILRIDDNGEINSEYGTRDISIKLQSTPDGAINTEYSIQSNVDSFKSRKVLIHIPASINSIAEILSEDNATSATDTFMKTRTLAIGGKVAVIDTTPDGHTVTSIMDENGGNEIITSSTPLPFSPTDNCNVDISLDVIYVNGIEKFIFTIKTPLTQEIRF